MNEICQIGNYKIANINSIFCSECNKMVSEKAKRCHNFECKLTFCEECSSKNKNSDCPKCKNGKLKDFSINSFRSIEELFFFCYKSLKCKEKYTLEEIQKNHKHTNTQIIQCNNCNSNLYNTSNFLICSQCNNFFYYKNTNYNPFFCKEIKHSEKNCGTRCFKCFKPICNKCNKKKYNYIICPECNYKCEICSKNISETICEYCNKILCNACNKQCKKCSMTLCPNDFKNKNECNKHKIKLNDENKCSICKINKFNKNCSICNSNICSISCLIICNISSNKHLICINCSLFCNICKNIICKKCSIKCSNCPKNNSLISCIKCNSDTIINCSMKNCNIKLCLKCIKYCNYCEEINCLTHSLSCAKCSETICRFHWHICKKCSKKNEEKLCLKNCTYKCYYCTNEINALCKEENHIEDFCKKFACGHYVCNSCLKKCDDCQKVIQGCAECEATKIFSHCRLCNKYICFDCAKKCPKCNEYYCNENHNCDLCGKLIKNDVCQNCDFIYRSKCLACSKGLSQCESCFRKIICSPKCFLDYVRKIINNNNKNKNSGFIRSYTIQSNKSTSYKSSITNNMINNVINLFQTNKDKDKEKNSTIYNNNNNNYRSKSEFATDRGKHLCLMYWCEEHLGININEPVKIKSNNLKDLIERGNSDNNLNRYKKMNNQTNTKCSSCIII